MRTPRCTASPHRTPSRAGCSSTWRSYSASPCSRWRSAPRPCAAALTNIAAVSDDNSWLMRGMPPIGDSIVGVHNWSTYPHLRWGFLHTREVVPTARIERGGGPVLELPRAERDITSLEFEAAGARMTVGDMIA